MMVWSLPFRIEPEHSCRVGTSHTDLAALKPPQPMFEPDGSRGELTMTSRSLVWNCNRECVAIAHVARTLSDRCH